MHGIRITIAIRGFNDRVGFSDDVLLFHTGASADQAGAVTTLRQAGVVFTSDSVSLGKYGPFALPSEVRDAREFQQLRRLCTSFYPVL
jgi:hypothetical protein